MNRIALDTTFLIDLQNERRKRGVARGALDFLREHTDTVFYLPVIARGEYLEGFADPESLEARHWIDALEPIGVSREASTEYARVTRMLRAEGRLIGGNDLWIGCATKLAGMPLATANTGDFGRIPGLEVIDYRKG